MGMGINIRVNDNGSFTIFNGNIILTEVDAPTAFYIAANIVSRVAAANVQQTAQNQANATPESFKLQTN